jgi:uncharacterized protein
MSYSSTMYRTASEINSAMLRVYNHMAMAVITSMIVSLLVSSSPAAMAFLFTGIMKWIVIFAPLAAVFAISAALNNNPSGGSAMMMLHGFAALMGLSMSAVFVVYTGYSIFTAFVSAAILFGTLSAYGYFTQRDLSSVGQFMFVGLIAIILASIANLVLANFWPGMIDNALTSMVISAIAVVVFLGLTAWDTQRIRQAVSVDVGPATEVQGALSLYINFINIFLSLLQLFGNREE